MGVCLLSTPFQLGFYSPFAVVLTTTQFWSVSSLGISPIQLQEHYWDQALMIGEAARTHSAFRFIPVEFSGVTGAFSCWASFGPFTSIEGNPAEAVYKECRVQVFISVSQKPHLIWPVQSVDFDYRSLRCGFCLVGIIIHTHTGPFRIRLFSCVHSTLGQCTDRHMRHIILATIKYILSFHCWKTLIICQIRYRRCLAVLAWHSVRRVTKFGTGIYLSTLISEKWADKC